MAIERTPFSILAPQIVEALPVDLRVLPVGQEAMKQKYDIFTPLTEAEEVKISEAMKSYVDGTIGNHAGRDAKRLQDQAYLDLQIIAPTRRSVDEDTYTRFIDNLANGSINLETIEPDNPDLLRLGGMLVELDTLWRQRGVPSQDLRQEIAGVEELMKEYFGSEVGGDVQGGPINFQDPERAKQDFIDAINKWRSARNLHRVVSVPKNYYQQEKPSDEIPFEVTVPDDLFLPGTRVIKPELLERPTEISSSRDRGIFRVVPAHERVLSKIPESYQRLVSRLQTVQFVLSLANGEGGAQQYLRITNAALKAEGMDAGTLVKKFLPALAKAQELYGTYMTAIGGHDIRGLKDKILDPLEMVSLLELPGSSIICDQVDGGPSIVAEIGPAQVVNTAWGDVDSLIYNNEGQPLYHVPGQFENDGVTPISRPYDAFPVSVRKRLKLSHYLDDHPLRKGRVIPAQDWFTQGPIMREEVGGGFWFNHIKKLILRKMGPGKTLGDLRGIRGLSMNNGKPILNTDSRVVSRVRELHGDLFAGGELMLQEVVFGGHGGELIAGMGVAMQLQRGRMGDLGLMADGVSEIDINMAMRAEHTHKYELLPPLVIRMLKTYHKSIEYWKKDTVDWLLQASKAKKGFFATWRNPLNPEKGTEIVPIQYRNELDASGKPLSVQDKINSLRHELRKRKDGEAIPSDEVLLANTNLLFKLDMGQTLIEALTYSRNEWGSSNIFVNYANAIADLSSQAYEKQKAGRLHEANALKRKAKIVSAAALKMYVKTYDSLAPSAVRRPQVSIWPIVEAAMDDEEISGWLEDFNFKGTLVSVGDKTDIPDENAYMGLQGFALCIPHRTAETIAVGNIDKPGKYGEKYPEIAAEYGKMLMAIPKSLNNSINSMIMGLAFGKEDRMKELNADQFDEAMAKFFVDYLFVGARSQTETSNLLKEMIETIVTKALSNQGHLSTMENEKQVANVFKQIHVISQSVVQTHFSFSKELIDSKGREAAVKRAGLEYITFKEDNEIATVELRSAGFDTNYPADITNKKPYISLGDEPLPKVNVNIDDQGVLKAEVRKVQHLGAYGHRGAEALTIVILCMMAKDSLLISSGQADRIISELKIDPNYYKKIQAIASEQIDLLHRAEDINRADLRAVEQANQAAAPQVTPTTP